MKAPQINDLAIAAIAAKAFIALPPGPSAGAQAAPSGIGSALDSVSELKVHHHNQTGTVERVAAVSVTAPARRP